MATKNRHIFELRLGKVGLILFVCGMSVLLFSMFLLGIVVGKHMEAYPEKFSPGVAELIRDRLFAFAPQAGRVNPSTKAGKSNAPADGEESFDLTFYKTLGGKKDGAQAAKAAGPVRDQSPETSASVPVSTGEPELSPEESAVGAVGNVTLAASGEDAKEPTRLPTKEPTVDSGSGIPVAVPAISAAEPSEAVAKGHLEVQVAAHQDQRKAEQLVKKLKTLGFASRVAAKDLPGKGRWFRVIVGGFETREKAKAAANQIEGKIRGVKCVIRSSAKE
jgi:DedD protein